MAAWWSAPAPNSRDILLPEAWICSLLVRVRVVVRRVAHLSPEPWRWPGDSVQDVDVRIGVTQAPREINIELAEDADRDDVKKRIEAALSGASDVLAIIDKRGNETFVPSAKIAYAELGSQEGSRSIGFGG